MCTPKGNTQKDSRRAPRNWTLPHASKGVRMVAGVMSQMMEMIQQCPECIQKVRQPREPLLITPLPDYPWQMVGTDLFELKKVHYVIVIDYFSRYPEVIKLTSTTSSAAIAALQAVFSRHGIPDVVRSDNGPQYASQEFAQFAHVYGFRHVCSSPKFPQSNGQVERTVQTVKQLLKQRSAPYKSLLNYHSTPFPWCGRSPSELLMGRRLRTTVPQTDEYLIPQWSYLPEFREQNKAFKEKQKEDFDRHHRTRKLSEIPDDTEVSIETEGGPSSGQVRSSAETPRSYIVETQSGLIQRNRYHLKPIPNLSNDAYLQSESRNVIMTRSRTGTEIHPPERLY